MRRRIRSHLTYANVMVTILAFVVIGGGTALGAFVVSSNSQIGPGTISGHTPPTGKHANIIAGSINSQDITNESLGSADIKNGQVSNVDLAPPEASQPVALGSTSGDACSGGATAVFCSQVSHFTTGDVWYPWRNFGSGFANAAFYMDQLGIVHLQGVIANNQNRSSLDVAVLPIFRLPASYRPAHNHVFASVGQDPSGDPDVDVARVDVGMNGVVSMEQDCAFNSGTATFTCSGNGDYLTLDGISFRRDG
jgi:hypothetical protein